jgi:Rv0078B-related antitoxin
LVYEGLLFHQGCKVEISVVGWACKTLELIFFLLLERFGMTPKKLVIEVMDDAMADILRQKTAFEKLRIAGRMWQSARVFLRGAIRTEYPDWNADQVNREIAKRISHGVVNDDPR